MAKFAVKSKLPGTSINAMGVVSAGAEVVSAVLFPFNATKSNRRLFTFKFPFNVSFLIR